MGGSGHRQADTDGPIGTPGRGLNRAGPNNPARQQSPPSRPTPPTKLGLVAPRVPGRGIHRFTQLLICCTLASEPGVSLTDQPMLWAALTDWPATQESSAMKCSICSVVTGLVVAGALGAATYKTVTGGCVFGSCSADTDRSSTDTGSQLVGLTGRAEQAAGDCKSGADGCLVAGAAGSIATGDASGCDAQCGASCPTDTSDCPAHQAPELVALSPETPDDSSGPAESPRTSRPADDEG